MRRQQIKKYLESGSGTVHTSGGLVFSDSFTVGKKYFRLFSGRRLIASFPLSAISDIFALTSGQVQVYLT